MAKKLYRHFYSPSEFADNNFIVSDGMGEENNPNFYINRKYLNNYLLMYVISGNLYCEQNNKKIILKSNQGVILNLKQYHKYYFAKFTNNHSENNKIIWFHFRGKPCESIINELIMNDKIPFTFSNINIINEIYEIFSITQNKKSCFEFDISIKIYELIMEILKHYENEIISTNKHKRQFYFLVDSYIDENFNRKIALDDMAKLFNINKFSFCKLFKSETGMTPFQYIKTKKIDYAKKYLIYSNSSISEISNNLNFYDQSHFTNTFKHLVGCTPKEYRKKLQE